MKNWLYSFVLLILTSCIQEPENNGLGGYISDEDSFNEINPIETETFEDLSTLNENIKIDTSFIDFINNAIEQLHTHNLKEFAQLFHPEKGCNFTPYTWTSKTRQNFKTKQFIDLLDSTNLTLNWGVTDGEGAVINLSIQNYFNKYVYDFNYKNKATEIHHNKYLAQSNTLNNIKSIFPNSEFMEFYFEGSKEFEGMDWTSLLFYAEKYNHKYYLVAVAHNQWTI